jgi:hypothetical protein
MSGSVNKVLLVGNVSKDPETRSTQDGKRIASFSLATSESWRDTAIRSIPQCAHPALDSWFIRTAHLGSCGGECIQVDA